MRQSVNVIEIKACMSAIFLTLIAGVVMFIFTNTAYSAEPASEECKKCITKCVIEEDKWYFKDCINMPSTKRQCNPICTGADRIKLRRELSAQEKKKCETDYWKCKSDAGGDHQKTLLCASNNEVCKRRLDNFLH